MGRFDGIDVQGGPLPGMVPTPQAAMEAVREMRLAHEIAADPLWSVVLDMFMRHRANARSYLLTARDKAGPAQIKAKAFALPGEIVNDALAIEEQIKDWAQEGNVHVAVTDFTPDSALRAIGHAERAAEFCGKTGWQWLASRLRSVAWAHADMLADASDTERPAHRDWINGIFNVFETLQSVIDLGADAEAWQLAQAEEQKDRKE